ncbi:MAG: RNase adapter RapZ [Candidatus Aminicenantes bacterium]|nr:RNase adapter RapZ [Candidatus Aminicenantes bacterium]
MTKKKDFQKDNRFLIITGLSGSGKTVVSHFLEDLGYYCIDNLPAKLIPNFIDLWLKKEVEIDKVALVVDMREPGFLHDFPRVFAEIKTKIPVKLIFLDASDEALVKRFSESRRPHPLYPRKPVLEAISLERKRLEAIKAMADEIIDTSQTTIAQLRELMTKKLWPRPRKKLQIAIITFGYKYGLPLEADLIFDTRFLANPFYIDRFRNKTGKSPEVRKFVLNSPETKDFLEKMTGFILYLLPKFINEGKSYLTIGLGCTGGKHRSVVIGEELKNFLKQQNYDIKIIHRDLGR